MKHQYRSTTMKQLARNLAAVVFASALTAVTANAFAAVTVTVGEDVVTSPDRSADFSALPLLFNIPSGYVENGLKFSFDQSQGHANAYIVNVNWPCCGAFVASQGFTGNVAYFQSDSQVPYKYAGISTSDGASFSALQFKLASGYGGATNTYWEAFDQATLVGSGSFAIAAIGNVAPATVVGFNGGTFTELRIGTYGSPFSTFAFQGVNGNAAEIADVLANVTPVPEPESLAMLLAGLGLLGLVTRRKAARSSPVA